jgi:hypothetical protein
MYWHFLTILPILSASFGQPRGLSSKAQPSSAEALHISRTKVQGSSIRCLLRTWQEVPRIQGARGVWQPHLPRLNDVPTLLSYYLIPQNQTMRNFLVSSIRTRTIGLSRIFRLQMGGLHRKTIELEARLEAQSDGPLPNNSMDDGQRTIDLSDEHRLRHQGSMTVKACTPDLAGGHPTTLMVNTPGKRVNPSHPDLPAQRLAWSSPTSPQ